MKIANKISMVCIAGAALSACVTEPTVNGHALPSDATISAFIEHDRKLEEAGKAPSELVRIDTEIGQSLKEARQAAAANDTAKIEAMDPRVRALLDRRKALVGNNAATPGSQPANGNPGYAQMLQWDRNAVAHGAADPVILKYDAQMVNLQPGSPEYERFAGLKLAADQKLWREVFARTQQIQPNPCQGPMGQNLCAAPSPTYDAGPTDAQKQQLQDEEYRRQQQINGNE